MLSLALCGEEKTPLGLSPQRDPIQCHRAFHRLMASFIHVISYFLVHKQTEATPLYAVLPSNEREYILLLYCMYVETRDQPSFPPVWFAC